MGCAVEENRWECDDVSSFFPSFPFDKRRRDLRMGQCDVGFGVWEERLIRGCLGTSLLWRWLCFGRMLCRRLWSLLRISGDLV